MCKWIIPILISLFILGCEKVDGRKEVSLGRHGDLRLIRLEDGTKCAVVVGYNKAAIDCNWKQR